MPERIKAHRLTANYYSMRSRKKMTRMHETMTFFPEATAHWTPLAVVEL